MQTIWQDGYVVFAGWLPKKKHIILFIIIINFMWAINIYVFGVLQQTF